MQATNWEFKNRAMLFGMVFAFTFPLYALDSQNSSSALANLLAPKLHMNPDRLAQLLLGCGAFVLIVAAFLRTWASSYLHSEVVYAAEVKTKSLVADGPYRFVRNPLYLANILMAIALGAMMSRARFRRRNHSDAAVLLPLDPARRSRPASYPGSFLSAILRSGPTFISCSYATHRFFRPSSQLGSGIQSRSMVLGIRCRRSSLCHHSQNRALFRHPHRQHSFILDIHLALPEKIEVKSSDFGRSSRFSKPSQDVAGISNTPYWPNAKC
jgi:hypothetical protein